MVDELRVTTELGRVAEARPHGLATGQAVEVLIRPDDMLYDESSLRRATWWASPFAAPNISTPFAWPAAPRSSA
jgi:hypothetical protein